MKKLFIILGFLTPFILMGQTSMEQKVVFDCASDDMDYISSRMWLIAESAREFEEKKIPYKMVLTIHSGCTEIVSKEAAKEDETLQKIQNILTELSDKYHVAIEGCELAINRNGYTKKDIHPVITTVRNSITRVIMLQNEGYAFIPFH